MSVNEFFRDSVISSFSSDTTTISLNIQDFFIFILLLFVIILQLFLILKRPVVIVVKIDRYCVKEEPIDISD